MASQKGKDLLVGAIVGTVLGAVTALLFAPKSGRELRADIAEQYNNVSEKTQEIAGQLAEKSKEVAKSVSEHTVEWAGKTKEAALGIADQVKTWKNGKQESASAEALTAEASVAATTQEQEDK